MALAAAGLVGTVVPRVSRGVEFDWSGLSASTANWSTAGNWYNNAAPPTGGSADLQFGVASRATSVVDVPYAVNSVTFNDGASAFNLSGQAVTVGSGGITNNGTANQSIGNAVVVGSTQSWSFAPGAGTLNLGGSVTVATGTSLALSGGNINHTGASFTADGSATVGTILQLTGVTLMTTATLTVGNLGNAYALQSAGSVTTPTLALGVAGGGVGTFAMIGGTSNADRVVVGQGGRGTFNVFDGSVRTGIVTLGASAGSSGTWAVGGGSAQPTVSVSSGITVGNAGSGSLVISSGVVLGDVAVAATAGSTGVVQLNGGNLILPSGLSGGQGTSTAYFNGGTLSTSFQYSNRNSTVSGLTHAYVQAGGLTIAVQATGMTFGVPIQPDPSAAAGTIDGGLSVSGQLGGGVILTAANTYAGPTTVAGGGLAVDGSIGPGRVTVTSGGTLAGTGRIANTTGPVIVAAGGTITAGELANVLPSAAATIGTLTTGAEQWNTSGGLAVKVSPNAATHDQLNLSGLTLAATAAGRFGVAVTSTGTPTLTAANRVVLVADTEAAATNPFAPANAAATLAKLSLTVTGVRPAAGLTLALATQPDPVIPSAYDLVLVAAPEPASLALLTTALAPALFGRRRR